MARKSKAVAKAKSKTMGQVAYEGYKNRTEGISPFSHKPLPPWEGVPYQSRKSWETAAKAVGEVLLAAGLIQSVPELPETEEVDEVEPGASVGVETKPD